MVCVLKRSSNPSQGSGIGVLSYNNKASLNSFRDKKQTLLWRFGVIIVVFSAKKAIKKQSTKQQHVISAEMSLPRFSIPPRVVLLRMDISLCLLSSSLFIYFFYLHSSHPDHHPPTGPERYQRNQSHYDLRSHTRPQCNSQVKAESFTKSKRKKATVGLSWRNSIFFLIVNE